ncbi:hypothetical protein HX049_06785 [Myroides odoratimimus]|uniref:hypothetical protein n=1 Tax=Myroides odoratimimus TaxID=76832 RepID=UPI0025764008|nr:hypothetical protein [Myroides odoratimimus]MDM1396877.1 hypothetical protein [Myroides odoratimimus]
MKTLQPLELDKIRQELINHKVEYIEVIEELTDHIANGIEQQWRESNTQVSFEEALTIEINKFGIKGLSKVQSTILNIKIQECGLVVLKGVKDCLTSFKLLAVIAVVLSLYSLMTLTQHSLLLASLSNLIILIIFGIGQVIVFSETLKALQKYRYMNGYKKTLNDKSYSIIASVICIIVFGSTHSIKNYMSVTDNGILPLSFIYTTKSVLFTLLLLTQYSVYFYLKPKYVRDKNNLLKTN